MNCNICGSSMVQPFYTAYCTNDACPSNRKLEEVRNVKTTLVKPLTAAGLALGQTSGVHPWYGSSWADRIPVRQIPREAPREKTCPYKAEEKDTKNEIQITISGLAGTGTTTIGRLIADALAEHGISVKIHDPEHGVTTPKSEWSTEFSSKVNSVARNAKVTVKTSQTRRYSWEELAGVYMRGNHLAGDGRFPISVDETNEIVSEILGEEAYLLMGYKREDDSNK